MAGRVPANPYTYDAVQGECPKRTRKYDKMWQNTRNV